MLRLTHWRLPLLRLTWLEQAVFGIAVQGTGGMSWHIRCIGGGCGGYVSKGAARCSVCIVMQF